VGKNVLSCNFCPTSHILIIQGRSPQNPLRGKQIVGQNQNGFLQSEKFRFVHLFRRAMFLKSWADDSHFDFGPQLNFLNRDFLKYWNKGLGATFLTNSAFYNFFHLLANTPELLRKIRMVNTTPTLSYCFR